MVEEAPVTMMSLIEETIEKEKQGIELSGTALWLMACALREPTPEDEEQAAAAMRCFQAYCDGSDNRQPAQIPPTPPTPPSPEKCERKRRIGARRGQWRRFMYSRFR